MKKFLVFFMTIFMILGIAATVMAEGSSGDIYLDLAVSGSSSDSKDVINGGALSGKNDLNFDGKSGYTVGCDYVFGSFKAVLEYSNDSFTNNKYSGSLILPGTDKSQFDYTAAITLAKVGYRAVHNDQFSLDLMAGYLGLSISGIGYSIPAKGIKSGDMNYSNGGPMAALDFCWMPIDRLEISGTYGTTFGASSSMELLDNDIPKMYTTTVDSKSSTLTAYRIKALYMFWDNVGLSLSYSVVNSSLKYSYSNGAKVNDDATYSGIALGATYKF